ASVDSSSCWPPKFCKLDLEFHDGVRMAFTDPRRFGKIQFLDNPSTQVSGCSSVNSTLFPYYYYRAGAVLSVVRSVGMQQTSGTNTCFSTSTHLRRPGNLWLLGLGLRGLVSQLLEAQCWVLLALGWKSSSSSGLVGLLLSSSFSQGWGLFMIELTLLVLNSSTVTTLLGTLSVGLPLLGLSTTLRQACSTALAPHPPRVPMPALPENTTSCLRAPHCCWDTLAASSSNCMAHKAHNADDILGRTGDMAPSESHEPVSKLGFDVIAELPALPEFRARFGAYQKPGSVLRVKALLLDQGFTAGIGNWVADEVLYQARVHPEQLVADMPEPQVGLLLRLPLPPLLLPPPLLPPLQPLLLLLLLLPLTCCILAAGGGGPHRHQGGVPGMDCHMPGCGAGLASAALPLPLPLPLVGSAAGSASVRLLRLAGGGVLGPGSEAAGCVAAWLLRGACGGLRGATTGHHIRPRTGWWTGKRASMCNGKPVEFVTVGSRTSAFVPSLQRIITGTGLSKERPVRAGGRKSKASVEAALEADLAPGQMAAASLQAAVGAAGTTTSSNAKRARGKRLDAALPKTDSNQAERDAADLPGEAAGSMVVKAAGPDVQGPVGKPGIEAGARKRRPGPKPDPGGSEAKTMAVAAAAAVQAEAASAVVAKRVVVTLEGVEGAPAVMAPAPAEDLASQKRRRGGKAFSGAATAALGAKVPRRTTRVTRATAGADDQSVVTRL
ncbi:hypothetical protein QJQ45_017668, partial [Haematococcus lacustris]